MLLPALGAFALVGFKVTGPDMRATAEHYFAGYHLTDLTVIGDMGLDSDDEVRIEEASGIVDVEYDYLKDATVSGTHDAVRVWSRPEHLSEFEVAEGRLPEAADEVAVNADLAGTYPVGSTINLPAHRPATVRAEYQGAIDDGQQKVGDANQQLTDAKSTHDDVVAQIADGEADLADARATLA